MEVLGFLKSQRCQYFYCIKSKWFSVLYYWCIGCLALNYFPLNYLLDLCKWTLFIFNFLLTHYCFCSYLTSFQFAVVCVSDGAWAQHGLVGLTFNEQGSKNMNTDLTFDLTAFRDTSLFIFLVISVQMEQCCVTLKILLLFWQPYSDNKPPGSDCAQTKK